MWGLGLRHFFTPWKSPNVIKRYHALDGDDFLAIWDRMAEATQLREL